MSIIYLIVVLNLTGVISCADGGAVGPLRSGSKVGHPTWDQMWGQPCPNKEGVKLLY